MSDQQREQMTEQQRRLFDMARVLDDSGCWIWQGQISNTGYGRLKAKDSDNQIKMMSAQSVSYQEFIKNVPEGHLVKQSCGNRLCINPDHLALIKI